MYCKWLIIFFLIFSIKLMAQISSEKPLTREIIISRQDTITRVYIFVENPIFQPKKKRRYSWYQKQSVLNTRGAWSGKLLHGKYEVFYPNHNLLEQGVYHKGLRVGDWITWYASGEKKESIAWKQGQKHGVFERYNEEGEVIEKGKYCHNKRHGIVLVYEEDKWIKQRYKAGELIKKK